MKRILPLLGLVALLGFSSCRKKDVFTKLGGEIFHTYYSIQYNLDSDYTQAIDSTFTTFSNSLNPFDPNSLVSAINKNRTEETDSMLRVVWRTAYKVSEATEGSYDVSCSPLINLWGFGFEKRDSITPHDIDSVRQFVDYRRIRLEGTRMIKGDPRMQLDLSSLSKGYCSDLVAQTLERKGATRYLVELGGEIAYRGLNPDGKPWNVGINKPIDDANGGTNELQLVIQLPGEQGGVATSGNYRNFKIINGKKYAHTIDPKSGYPIQTDVLSATIIAPNCMLADALATACMTKSSKEVPALIKKFNDVEYMLILGDEDHKFRTEMSPGFEELILRQNK